MRLVAVEQLRKIENDALEVNIYIYTVYIYILLHLARVYTLHW